MSSWLEPFGCLCGELATSKVASTDRARLWPRLRPRLAIYTIRGVPNACFGRRYDSAGGISAAAVGAHDDPLVTLPVKKPGSHEVARAVCPAESRTPR